MLNKLVLTFGTSVAIMFINIAGGILTARLLGPLGKGQLTAVALWPSVLASVGNLGLVNAIVYYSGKNNNDNVKTIWSGSFAVGLLQTLLFGALGYFFIPIFMRQFSAELIWMARLFLFFIPLNIFTQYSIAILQGRLHIAPYNFVRFLVPGSYLVGVIILAVLDRVTVQSCIAVLLLSNAITLLFEVLYLNKLGWLSKRINIPLIRQMLGYGLKAHIGNISSLLNLRLDQMVMAVILTADKLGLYVVAVTISSGVNLITDAIATITFPTISANILPEEKRVTLARSLRISFWCSIFCVLILLLTTDLIINILFGKEFAGAIPAARVLIVAASISGMNMTLASGLKGYGKPSISSVGEVISLFITGILLWLLMPRWGIVGAAVASLIAYSCNFMFMYFYIWQKFSICPKEAFLPQSEDYLFIQSLKTNILKGKYINS